MASAAQTHFVGKTELSSMANVECSSINILVTLYQINKLNCDYMNF
jgi:hypothetical protein